ncbi:MULTISPECIES: cell division protein ZapB [Nitrincola]|uniref:Cell division protein ZapB n=1 Tax=Nitrincola nitratireducens TaxID=1229521 RepID=W9UY75_9GAMM|nr:MULTISPECIES: cell division protein ZapB [Nitrincola]EXJ12034.1 hypothetical protein D791_00916 [Nitrincola nitratireducens]
MQSELFNQLEEKIESLIEEVETLRLEISELKGAQTALEHERNHTQDRLQALLGKFDRLADSADL